MEELDYDLPKESIERLNGGPVTITPLYREIHGVQDFVVFKIKSLPRGS